MSEIDVMYSVSQGIANGKTGYEFCYCIEEDKWYQYSLGYWKQIDEIELMSIALQHFNGANNTVNITRFSSSRRGQILDNLVFLVFKKLTDFNKNGFLNFDIGEFDPITQTMHDHKKENYSTLRMPYPYHHSGKIDLWLKTLDEVFEGNEDKIEVLQEFFGYCLTRDTKQRKALLLIGPSNCGKSTILWTLRNLVGDENCSDVGVNFLGNPQHGQDMMNKLINFDTDTAQDADSYEEAFKKIVGGEPIRCSPKYVKTFSYKPYAKQAYGSNGFPRVTDHSEAFYNRLLPIPCERVFDEEEQKKDLPEQLKAEMSGIFNWAVEGLQRLNKRGYFEIKDFMKQARQDLRDESNPIDVFFRETIETTKEFDSYIVKPELYNKYLDWCRNNGNSPMSNIKFSKTVFQKYSKVTEKSSRLDNGTSIWRYLKYKTNMIIPTVKEIIQWEEN